jgi:hypothetical protein
LDKELSEWKGVGRAFGKEVFQGRETVEVRDVSVEGREVWGETV